jgi:predicted DNA-binding transcriptional regulator AlpA
MAATTPAAVQSSPASAEATSAVRGRPRKNSTTSEYIRASELLEMVPFSRATLWRRVRDEEFPQPVPISPGITAWRRVEVEGWLKEKGKGIAAGKKGGKRQP